MPASGTNRCSRCYAMDGKHVSTAVNQHITTEEMLQVVFFEHSMSRLCSEDQQGKSVRSWSRQLVSLALHG
jgi:hypothetical protein